MIDISLFIDIAFIELDGIIRKLQLRSFPTAIGN